MLWRYAEQDSRVVTAPFRAFMFFLSILVILISFFKKKTDERRQKNNYYVMFCLFIIAYSLKVIFDLLNAPLKAGYIYEMGWNYELYIIIPSFIGLASIIDELDFKQITQYSIPVVVLTVFFSFVSSRLIYYNSLDSSGRVSLGENLVLNTISLGHLGVSGSIICMTEWTKTNTRIQKIALTAIKALTSILSIYIIVYAGAKGPVMSIVAVIFVLFFIRTNHFYRIISVLMVVIFSLTHKSLLSLINNVSTILYVRFEHLFYEGDEGRISLIRDAIQEFMRYPLGGGYFIVPYIGYSHNFIIDCLMTWGIFGVLLILILIFKSFSNVFYMLNKTNAQYHFISLLFIQKFVAANFSGTLYMNFPLILLFACVLYYDKKRITEDLNQVEQ